MERTKRPRTLNIVVVDDQKEEYQWIGQVLDRLPNVKVNHWWISNPLEVNDLHELHDLDAILIDFHLEDLTAPEALDLFNYGVRSLPIIMMTSTGGISSSVGGLEKGATLFMDKNELEPSLIERILLYSIRQKEHEARLSKFAGYVAHDIAAPLRSIQSFANILLDSFSEHVGETEKEVANDIIRSSKKSLNLVDDLLTYTLAAQSEIEITEVKFSEFAHSAVEGMRDTIEEADADVVVEETDLTIHCSTSLTNHVLTNLIQNGIKYNNSRSPSIKVSYEYRDHWQVVSITDNGIGLEMKHAKQVFEPLYRLQDVKKSSKGTGLGLAICKEAIERQGGNIWIQSEPNVGTTVFFRIPFPEH
ncbi:sensor histidine kinase [Pelagicoccus albus]|uniref:histidine kinase n=1 Tax=Pelagicoccus albus TaxID=415222 RepID=A0A7X1B3S9_9BACT|nr:hybrid sensor histidine kinase/response regulator [Pelagicoccus albus]MBC2604997.1 hybrid sensor histidine kinase/response regulator [Pelagicoccus albus]